MSGFMRKIIAEKQTVITPVSLKSKLYQLDKGINIFCAEDSMDFLLNLLDIVNKGENILPILSSVEKLKFLSDTDRLDALNESPVSKAQKSIFTCLTNLREDNLQVIRQTLSRNLEILEFEKLDERYGEPGYLSEDLKNAVESGDLITLKELIKKGADVNEIYEKFDTALIYAAKKCNMEIIRELINAGADVNYSDNDSITPLQHAICEGDIEVVKELIKSGADINYRTRQGNSALMIAIKAERIEIANLLLDKGADIIRSNNKKETCLLLAAKSKNKALVERIINILKENIKSRGILNNYYGNTRLLEAAALETFGGSSRGDEINLLNYINWRDASGFTPLMEAARNGALKIVHLLVEAGANVSLKKKYEFCDKRKAFHFAQNAEYFKIADYLKAREQARGVYVWKI
ncbi:MAG: ankyrin repeat domain-containing protein [Candidatus Margulisbacteria bacterium]|nr:ankyrin repeat domain-containing protein [Candidatus Margulisiibacteriota bacterium]